MLVRGPSELEDEGDGEEGTSVYALAAACDREVFVDPYSALECR